MLLLGFVLPAAEAGGPHDVRYSRDIKPILSDNCYTCHGPDEGTRRARLRLDTREGALAELRRGRRAIVPGEPDASILLERVASDDDMDRMPPASTGKQLTPQQVDFLRRWIEAGAEFDSHWAYVPPLRPAVPDAASAAQPDEATEPQVAAAEPQALEPDNPIDRFVMGRLKLEGLRFSPEADRRTLLRRLSFDLTGLPPTPEEVRAFEEDASPEAYEKQVDRLLASPRYGERMAVYWLDLVRYGDSKGFHSDNPISVWPFRDYVINAFNDNKPFDVFTSEQLAGDLLPAPTTETLIASGYNRLNLHTEEGGAQPKEYLAKYVADRVRTTSTAWMGASVGCAECHDHKFDPYTMKDFYSFGAFFADISEVAVGVQPPNLRLPTGAQTAELQRLERRMAPLERQYKAFTPEFESALAAWEEEARARPDIRWTELQPLFYTASAGSTLTHESNAVRSGGERPDRDTYIVSYHTDLTGITGIRLETLTHPSLPRRGVGRADNANFVLSEFTVDAAPAAAPGDITRIELHNASADFSQSNYDVSKAIDGDPSTGWAVRPQVRQAHNAVFETKQPVGHEGGTSLVVTLDQQHGSGALVGFFRISVTTDLNPSLHNDPAGVPKKIRDLLVIEPDQRTPEQASQVRDHFRSVTPLLEPIRKQIAELQARHEEVEQEVATMLITEVVEPRTIRILPRGDWLDDSGPEVEPNVPEFLVTPDSHWQPPGNGRLNRLDLANWLIAPDNPLVARVFVNRLWYLLFGQGLVRTLDDFGAQSAWPSHPELLDWLAVEFIESGWDIKHMVRLMVASHTYRQSSRPAPDVLERDPGNQLLARQGRFRIDAEFVRDNALYVSGLLSPRIGGPSVFPYQPEGFWSFLNFPLRDYHPSEGEDQYRRGLYAWVQRTFPHPSLNAFDASSREECVAERPRSNTPLQALVLLNDPTYVEAARVFAARVLAETGGQEFEQRLTYLFQQALQREPRPREIELLAELCVKHMEEYKQDPAAAESLLKVGNAPMPEGDVTELAAWTSITRAVLNLHETITRN